MSPSKTISYRIPDFLASWPWKRNMSSDYLQHKAESTLWVESFNAFSNQKNQLAFNQCDFARLACLTYTDRDNEFVRVGCDLMSLYFIYDEYTDMACSNESKKIADSVIKAFREPYNPRAADGMISSMAQDFWRRALSLIPSFDQPCAQNFISGFEDYVNAVAQEAEDRSTHNRRTVREYLHLRRGTTSSKAIFSLLEFGLDLPDYVLNHPILLRLTETAADLCAITNDMHSYTLEQARGLEEHNIITCIQNEYSLDLQSALDCLGSLADCLVLRFRRDRRELPSWGPVLDSQVNMYINGLGNWVRGNDCWCYESRRYYGENGEHVKETRKIELRLEEEGLINRQDLNSLLAQIRQ